MKRNCLTLLLVFLVFSAEAQISGEDRQKATNFFLASDWKNTTTAYEKICAAEPTNWQAKNRLGIAYSELGNLKKAGPILEEAAKLSENNAQPVYHLARVYAKTGDLNKAFEHLDLAIKNGFAQLSRFERDPMLSPLTSDARYEPLHKRLMQAVIPCRYSEQSRQFDFWMGEWEVKNTTGQLAGRSSIQLILGDCIIFENWTSAPPNDYSGKSFNLYNSVTGKWQQTWVDDKGALIEFFDGEYSEGKMVFFTKPNQNNTVRRLTFFNVDSNQVRQFSELSNDDKKTWTTEYDFLYHRIK